MALIPNKILNESEDSAYQNLNESEWPTRANFWKNQNFPHPNASKQTKHDSRKTWKSSAKHGSSQGWSCIAIMDDLWASSRALIWHNVF